VEKLICVQKASNSCHSKVSNRTSNIWSPVWNVTFVQQRIYDVIKYWNKGQNQNWVNRLHKHKHVITNWTYTDSYSITKIITHTKLSAQATNTCTAAQGIKEYTALVYPCQLSLGKTADYGQDFVIMCFHAGLELSVINFHVAMYHFNHWLLYFKSSKHHKWYANNKININCSLPHGVLSHIATIHTNVHQNLHVGLIQTFFKFTFHCAVASVHCQTSPGIVVLRYCLSHWAHTIAAWQPHL